MLALFRTEKNFSNSDLEVINDTNNFLDNAILGLVDKQDIVVDFNEGFEYEILNHLGFNLISLDSYNSQTQTIKESQDVAVTLESEPTKERTSFFTKIFKKKPDVKENYDDLHFEGIQSLVGNIIKDSSKGDKLKTLLLERNILTKEQIKQVEIQLESSLRYGNQKKFIQCARELKLIGEDEAAAVLSEILVKEVISKNKCIVEEKLNLNKKYIDFLNNFFIFKIDSDNQIITICKDCSDTPKIYLLEQKFLGWHIAILNVVEGVTKEVLDL